MMQKLFDHMEQTHGLILTESELQDIVSAVGMDMRHQFEKLFAERDAALRERDEWRKLASEKGTYAK